MLKDSEQQGEWRNLQSEKKQVRSLGSGKEFAFILMTRIQQRDLAGEWFDSDKKDHTVESKNKAKKGVSQKKCYDLTCYLKIACSPLELPLLHISKSVYKIPEYPSSF